MTARPERASVRCATDKPDEDEVEQAIAEMGEADLAAADVSPMRGWCRDHGHAVLGYDERVHEATAAAILGYSAETLRGWRQEGTGPRHVRVRGRYSYRLADLAEWLAEEREREE